MKGSEKGFGCLLQCTRLHLYKEIRLKTRPANPPQIDHLCIDENARHFNGHVIVQTQPEGFGVFVLHRNFCRSACCRIKYSGKGMSGKQLFAFQEVLPVAKVKTAVAKGIAPLFIGVVQFFFLSLRFFVSYTL